MARSGGTKTTPEVASKNPDLPLETIQFVVNPIRPEAIRTNIQHIEKLHKAELHDVNQQIWMRWVLAGFFGLLLVLQHVGLFFVLLWSLRREILTDIQPLLAILVPATLAQTYGISRLIVDRMFKPIDFGDKQERFDDQDNLVSS